MPGEDREADQRLIARHAGADRIALIASSYRRLLGRELVPGHGSDIEDALWNAPQVVVAHGREADPVFFYANRAALDVFEADGTSFLRLPSRFSAEPLERGEREHLLGRVTRENAISDYAGVRISLSGKRFRIMEAVVWNLVDESGNVHGQAASFARWTPL